MKIRPINKYIIVKKIEQEEKKGIILVAEKKDSHIYSVYSVSEGVTSVKEGDRVFLDKYSALDMGEELKEWT